MEIHTTRFGIQEANPEKTIFFPKGISGFENSKKYQLFHENKNNHVVYYLQSMENPGLTLHTVMSEQFGMKYDFTLSDMYMKLLGAKDNSGLVALCIISKDNNNNEIHAHPECPIIINTNTKRAIQIKAGEVKLNVDEKVSQAA